MKLLYKQTAGISEEQITQTAQTLNPYIEQVNKVVKKQNYEDAESSINLPADEQLFSEVNTLAERLVTSQLKYIIDIGIGGSNLGTKAVYDALYGFFDGVEPNRFPKMFFVDTNNPEFLGKLTTFLKTNITAPEEILICAISKSGGTTETIANFEIIYASLNQKFPEIKNRCVAITDFESKFWKAAQEKAIATVQIPKQVGGRYSVLSTVGLFPLKALGLNIQALREGAKAMRQQCLNTDVEQNPALVSAVILYEGLKQGRIINDNFLFHGELESLGKWYRQLMGESIGKELDLQGKTVDTGITPTVSLGSTDLHSVGQLYLGGPKDKTTTFIYTEKSKTNVKTPQELLLSGLVEHISNIEAADIMRAILEGTKVAYTNRGLSFMEVVLDDISEHSIGEFLQFKMIEMMYLGKLLNVNTFDQPNVESYKVETKRILAK